jgi:hypothetical protein
MSGLVVLAGNDRFLTLEHYSSGKSGMTQNHPTEPVPPPTGKVC